MTIRPSIKQGRRIRLARVTAGLTQMQLAAQLDVQQSAVSQWERGRVSPEVETCIKLAAVLRIPVQDVLPERLTASDEVLREVYLRDPEVRQIIELFSPLRPGRRTLVRLFLQTVADLRDDD